MASEVFEVMTGFDIIFLNNTLRTVPTVKNPFMSDLNLS